MLTLIVSLLAAAAVVPGQTTTQSTPAPVMAAPAAKPMGYFLMTGTRIVSAPFSNANDCFKALAKLKASLQPGVDTLVCVHRSP